MGSFSCTSGEGSVESNKVALFYYTMRNTLMKRKNRWLYQDICLDWRLDYQAAVSPYTCPIKLISMMRWNSCGVVLSKVTK